MAVLGDIVAYLRMDNSDFSRKSLQSAGSSRDLSGALDGVTGAAIAGTAALAAMAGAAAAAKFFHDSAAAARSYSAELQHTFAIQDLSINQQERMRTAAVELSTDPAVKDGPDKLAQGYMYLAVAGLNAEKQLASLPQVAKFATAGQFDMALATDLATDAQSALGLSSSDTAEHLANMTRVTDVLVKANTLANASTEQFAVALTTDAAAAARLVGKEVEETVAVLAAFADQGTKGEEAGTRFAIVLRDLQTKAIENKAAFAAQGISVFDAAGEMLHMTDIIAQLEQRLAGMSDEGKKASLLQLGFSDKSVGGLMTLIGTSDKIRDYESALKSAGGTVDKVANKQFTDFDKSVKTFGAEWEKLKINVGQPLLELMAPVVAELGEEMGDLAERVVVLVGNINSLGRGIATLADYSVPDFLGDFYLSRGPDMAAEQLQGLQDSLDALGDRSNRLDLNVEVDRESLDVYETDLQALRERADQMQASPELRMRVDDSLREIEARLKGVKVKPVEVEVRPRVVDHTARLTAADLSDLESLGSKADQAANKVFSLQLRNQQLIESYRNGTLALSDFETAQRQVIEAMDEAAGGPQKMIDSLQEEIRLLGATAEMRKLAELQRNGQIGFRETAAIQQLQADLQVGQELVRLQRELNELRQPGSNLMDDLLANGAEPQQIAAIRSLKQQIDAVTAAKQKMADDRQAASALRDSVKTDTERLQDEEREIHRLRSMSLIDDQTATKALEKVRAKFRDLNKDIKEHNNLLSGAADAWSPDAWDRIFQSIAKGQDALRQVQNGSAPPQTNPPPKALMSPQFATAPPAIPSPSALPPQPPAPQFRSAIKITPAPPVAIAAPRVIPPSALPPVTIPPPSVRTPPPVSLPAPTVQPAPPVAIAAPRVIPPSALPPVTIPPPSVRTPPPVSLPAPIVQPAPPVAIAAPRVIPPTVPAVTVPAPRVSVVAQRRESAIEQSRATNDEQSAEKTLQVQLDSRHLAEQTAHLKKLSDTMSETLTEMRRNTGAINRLAEEVQEV